MEMRRWGKQDGGGWTGPCVSATYLHLESCNIDFPHVDILTCRFETQKKVIAGAETSLQFTGRCLEDLLLRALELSSKLRSRVAAERLNINLTIRCRQ